MLKRKDVEYLQFLDGLRTIAVGLVIVFHYWSNGLILPGGFIGVDIFFVISGFIITRSLINDCYQDTFDVKTFWIKRIKRLLPAVAVLLITLILMSMTFPTIREFTENSSYAWIAPYIPDLAGELVTIKGQLMAVILYYMNWHFIANGVSYFEQMGRPSLLMHLWSLAIEEQFYIFWPIFVPLIVSICKKNRSLIIASLCIPLILSIVLMVIIGKASPNDARAYFGTDCRAFALLFGALLAMFWNRWHEENFTPWQKYFLQIIGPCGLILIAYLSIAMRGGEIFIFHGGLFGAVCGTVMIIVAGRWNRSITSLALRNNVLSWIGKRSYGLYLWHWPVFILTDPAYNYPLNGVALICLRLTLLFGITHLSYKFIEIPMRNGGFMAFSQLHPIVKYANVAFVSILLISSSVAIVTAKSDSSPYGYVTMHKSPEATKEPHDDEIVLHETVQLIPETTDQKKVDYDEGNALTSEDIAKKVEKTTITDKTGCNAPKKEQDSPTEQILAIGDSVMLGTKVPLENNIAGAHVDAKVGRQFTSVLKIVKSLKSIKKIPSIVVIHSGTNGTINESQFVELMEILRPCKRVVIINDYVPRSWQNSNNEILSRIVPMYANTQLVNWHAVCMKNKRFLYKDGIHIGGAKGADLYVSKIKEALLL